MKLSRKLQLQVDSKIRHTLATSQHLMIPRSPTTGTHPKPEPGKADGNDTGHSK